MITKIEIKELVLKSDEAARNQTLPRQVQEMIFMQTVSQVEKDEISRAFSSMDDFINSTKHLIKGHGVWYGMKSKKILNNEMANINELWTLEKIDVPFLDAERYLVKVSN